MDDTRTQQLKNEIARSKRKLDRLLSQLFLEKEKLRKIQSDFFKSEKAPNRPKVKPHPNIPIKKRHIEKISQKAPSLSKTADVLAGTLLKFYKKKK